MRSEPSSLLQKITILAVFLYASTLLHSQSDKPREQTLNIWNGVKITKKLGKNLEVFVAPQIRYGLKSINKYFGEVGVEYEFLKILSITLGYRYVQNKKKKEGYKNIQRYYSDLSAAKEFGRWKPKLRLRYTNDEDFEDQIVEENIRSKLSLSYDIKKSKFKPSIGIELFQITKNLEREKLRLGGRIAYEFSKRNEVSLGYNLDYSYQKEKNTHILVAKYGYKF